MNVSDDFLKKTLLAAAESYPHEIPDEEYNQLTESVDKKVLLATWVYMHDKGFITKAISFYLGGDHDVRSPTLTAYGIDYIRELKKQES